MFLLSASSFLISIIPIAVICIGFYFMSKKKYEKNNEVTVFGRKGKKDHLWLVVKEYLRLENRIGLEIEKTFVFERPDKKELHHLIKKAKEFEEKNSLNKKFCFLDFLRKNKEPERYPIEDYFDQLEKETEILNKHLIEKNDQNNFFKSHRKDLIRKNNKFKKFLRRRYVILFKVYNPHKKMMGNWEAIEAELFKNEDPEEVLKDKLVINKKLDYLKELSWLLPLKIKQEKEQKIKKAKNLKVKNVSFAKKLKNLKLWKKLNHQN